MQQMFDIAVIGGGPGGYVAAIHAAQRGKNVLLAEGDTLGGVCLNRGCIPTKALLQSAHAYEQAKSLCRFGIQTGEVGFDFPQIMARKSQVVKGLTGGVAGLLKNNGVTVVNGWAEIISPGVVRVGEQTFEAADIILATGSVPFMPPIPGVQGNHVMNSDDALRMETLPASMAIIGGGVIGVEFAVVLSALGCEVTIVEMLDTVLSLADADVSKEMARALKKRGVALVTGAKVTQITPEGLLYEKNGEVSQIAAERVLVAIGRRANANEAMLDRLGIVHRAGRVEVDAYMRTNIPHIYAIGDVNGIYMLAHVASEEGVTAVDHILGTGTPMCYEAVPQCVYGSPEIAWVGLSEQAAKEKGLAVHVGMFPLSANGKCQVEGETAGFMKLVCEAESDRVIGVHMVGAHSTEMLMEGVLAVKEGLRAWDLANTIHPHPTAAEAVMEAALMAGTGKAHHALYRK